LATAILLRTLEKAAAVVKERPAAARFCGIFGSGVVACSPSPFSAGGLDRRIVENVPESLFWIST
jgi:hypothetical protein